MQGDAWNSAYLAVDSYLEALLVNDRLHRTELIQRVLTVAQRRAESDPGTSAVALAAEELDRLLTEWFSSVLDEPLELGNALLSARGRLALLLADMPGRWQTQFLQPGPWPVEFVAAMRESFLRAGPDFQLSQMQPRPIDLGPIMTLTKLSNVPYFSARGHLGGFALLLIIVFRMTH